MKKNYYFLILLLSLTFNQLMLSADTISPVISFEKNTKNQIVQLESKQKFKLKTLRQESDPTKLILVFEIDSIWQAKEIVVDEVGISRINLTPLNSKEYALEIQLNSNEAPDFELKNTIGNFKVIFPNTPIKTETEKINIVAESPANNSLLPTSPTLDAEQEEEKIEIKEILTQEPSTSPTASPEIDRIKSPSNPESLTKNLTAINFVNVDEAENYLLLAFSSKPNFSFTLTEQGHYEILIPEYKLSGQHLAQFFYAPQNNRGFINVKPEQIDSEEETKLLIKIIVEPFFQLTLIPIPEGIKVVPTVSTTK